MDALALLCTLHADGPSTLRELRFAGCHNLIDLVECNPQELAQYLKLSIASAERLQREATVLAGRMNLLEPDEPLAELTEEVEAVQEEVEDVPEPLEPKVVTPLPPSMKASRSNRSWFGATRIPLACSRIQPATETELEIASENVPEPAEQPELQLTELTAIKQLLEDREEPTSLEPAPSAKLALEEVEVVVEQLEPVAIATPEPESPVEFEPELAAENIAVELDLDLREGPTLIPFSTEIIEPLIKAADRRAELPAPEPEQVLDPMPKAPVRVEYTGATPLEVGLPDGLGSDLLEALASAGITTAEALVEASGLELSRKISIPFTRLLELQLGAQHLFRRTASSAPSKRSKVRQQSAPEPAEARRQRRHTDSSPTRHYLPTSHSEPTEFDSNDVGGPFA